MVAIESEVGRARARSYSKMTMAEKSESSIKLRAKAATASSLGDLHFPVPGKTAIDYGIGLSYKPLHLQHVHLTSSFLKRSES